MKIFIFITSVLLVYFNSFSTLSNSDFDDDETYGNTYQESSHESDDETLYQTNISSAEDEELAESEYDLDQDEQLGNYTPDNNPNTWDEDPDNYPLETPDTYENVDDEEVQSPTNYNDIPEGASAICRDGTYSFSKNRRGTCSHHGGVAQWLK